MSMGCIRYNTVTLFEVLDIRTDFVDFASHISSQNVGIFSDEDSLTRVNDWSLTADQCTVSSHHYPANM